MIGAASTTLRRTGTGTRRNDWRLLLLVAAAAFATHAQTLAGGLVWDDAHHVQQNTMVRSLANAPRMFVTDQWAGGSQDTTVTPYYRPLYKLSFALDFALWGERPFGYHLTNVLLHVLASALVFLLAFQLGGKPAAAAIAGLVFAVHPVHSEPVAWISARNELICGVFMLATLLFHEGWRRSGRRGALVLALSAFFASLLGKEMSITLPALVLFREWEGGRREGLRWLRIPAAYAAVAIVYLLIRTAVLEVLDWGGAPLWHRVLTAPGIVVRYLRLLAVPNDLRVFHVVRVQESLASGAVLLPLLVVLGVGVGAALAWRWDRRISHALVWILVTLAPVTGIPAELAPALMAERYLYVPSIGFALLLGALAARAWRWAGEAAAAGPSLARRAPGFALGTALVAGVSWLGVAAIQRDRVWADQRTFTQTWVREVPGDHVARVGLGVTYETEGRFADAEREYLTARDLSPGYAEAHAALGVLYDKMGRMAEAEGAYARALALAPRNAEILYNLGVHHLEVGRLDEAARVFEAVVALNPASEDAHYNLGLLFELASDRDRSVQHLEKAAAIAPGRDEIRAALERVRSGR